ncbi:MAG: tetratricopeptide repeat protein [Magnetococcales bacterium]|nr:tetratricopeptide repeat protein [Magnetococcales bacterium]
MTRPESPPPQTWLNLFSQGRFPEMERLARTQTEEHPHERIGWKMLGLALLQQGRLQEALPPMRTALERWPEDAETACYLGIILQETGRPQPAEACYRHALTLQPDHLDAHIRLGILLAEQKKTGAAVQACLALLAIHPDHAPTLNNLGVALQELGRHPQAESAYREALALQPDFAQVHCNLGTLLHEQRRTTEAEAAFRATLRLVPEHAPACNQLAILLQEQKRFDEAEAAFRQALHLQPDHADTRMNLSYLYLAQERYQEAWPLHEARYHPDITRRNAHPIDAPFPMWRGEPLAGKSLLIMHEQGFGDQIQFCRYVPRLKAAGARRITLVCEGALAALFARIEGVDQVLVAEQNPDHPAHDYWTLLLSIPCHLGTTPTTLPASLPYLRVSPERMAAWEQRLPRSNGLRVGLFWQGNPEFRYDGDRSLHGLSTLAPLWSVPGVSFVSLQKGHGEEEARDPPPGQPLCYPGAWIGDFMDTAALVEQLDLVICSDSAVAHLTGALGKPCWVLLSWNPDWRWSQERADSPWYPGVMRLFRQSRPGAWAEVVDRVATALRRLGQSKESSN